MNDKATVIAVNEAFYRAFEKKDIQAMSLVWSQGTGALCIHPGGDALQGWQQIRRSWEQIFQNTNYLEIDTEIISTEIGAHVAYVVLAENVLQVVRGRRLQAQSMATNVFQKMAQKWYLVHHHGSPVIRS
ncbi:MAG: nuclear transport factor 2 family protein [Cyanophyceae cyanobacterium]